MWSSEKCKGAVLVCQGQIGKNPLLNPGKLGIFLVLTLFIQVKMIKDGLSLK